MAAICIVPGIFALQCVVGLLSQSVTDQYIVRQAMWDNKPGRQISSQITQAVSSFQRDLL